MKRKIYPSLIHWKNKIDRKPLILQGARQVGKTYLLKTFGAEHFSKVHYLNFEKNFDLEKLFERNLDPTRIINELSFYLDNPINIKDDLVIFDEIQSCPKALTSLKYFQEELPQLALCSAGSLLGVHLNAGSFPVGKIDFIDMYPMTFSEFLLGIGDEKSATLLENISAQSEIPDLVHTHLWDRLKLYFITGGLPEVVSIFNQHQNDLYNALQFVRVKQNDLIQAYYADIAKHSGKVNAMHVARMWQSVSQQLARTEDGSAHKFKFKDIIPGVNRYSRLVNVIDWLEGAGFIIKIPIINRAELPLAAYTKENAFKLLIFDIGILGAMCDLSPKAILDYNYGTYKGYFAENFVAQEFLAAGTKHLYSWQEGVAEVEFIREIDEAILPIEVKSGWVTRTKSIKAFSQKYQPPYQTIFSANNLYIDTAHHIHRYPLYLASQFPLKDK
jgi:predicted AAA+ superfamily ATPase